MDNIRIHLFGWGEDFFSSHSVHEKVQEDSLLFNLGTQDCSVRLRSPASKSSGETILHRRFSEECGLLEHFMRTIDDSSLVTISNSNNHVVYTTSNDSLYSFDSRIEGKSPLSSDGQKGCLLNMSSDLRESLKGDDNVKPKLASVLQAWNEGIYKNYKHNLICLKRIILQIATGESHCLVIADSNELYSFGTGSCGELGIESTPSYTNSLQPVKFTNNDRVKYVAAGSYYSAVISVSGILYTFGCGAYYRLGHGTDENCNVPKKVEALEGVGMPGPYGLTSGMMISTVLKLLKLSK